MLRYARESCIWIGGALYLLIVFEICDLVLNMNYHKLVVPQSVVCIHNL